MTRGAAPRLCALARPLFGLTDALGLISGGGNFIPWINSLIGGDPRFPAELPFPSGGELGTSLLPELPFPSRGELGTSSLPAVGNSEAGASCGVSSMASCAGADSGSVTTTFPAPSRGGSGANSGATAPEWPGSFKRQRGIFSA